MTEKRDIRKFSKAVKGGNPRMQGYFGIIGKLDGTVLTGVPNVIWVTALSDGQPRKVINRRTVPSWHGLYVFVGSDEYSSNQTEVLFEVGKNRATNNGVPTVISNVPPHSHSYPGGNTTWVYAGQIMPLNVLPISGTLTVRVYPGPIRKVGSDGWKYIAEQVVDVSGDVPGSGALWIMLQANDDGTVDYVVGSVAASRSALDETDIPEVTTGRALFAIILEAGRNELFRNNVVNDFMDLRFDRGGGLASLVDAADVTYTPSELADWDYLNDPGSAGDALDQLASRTADLEGLVPLTFGLQYRTMLWELDGAGSWTFVTEDDGSGNDVPIFVLEDLE